VTNLAVSVWRKGQHASPSGRAGSTGANSRTLNSAQGGDVSNFSLCMGFGGHTLKKSLPDFIV
jgi:hypothetical protein